MNSITNIYVLIDPRDNEIRYVGKTVKSLRARLTEHKADAKKGGSYRNHWHQQLTRLGYEPIIQLVQVITSDDWAKAEQYWIQYYKDLGCSLTNLTVGGEGALGRVVSEETKAKISAAGMGRKPSSETLIKLRISHLGKKLSSESKEKQSAALRGRKRSPESNAKTSATLMGHEVSAETRAKLSDANTGRPNPHKGYVPSDETRAKNSAALKGRPWSPARRAAEDARQETKRLEANANPNAQDG